MNFIQIITLVFYHSQLIQSMPFSVAPVPDGTIVNVVNNFMSEIKPSLESISKADNIDQDIMPKVMDFIQQYETEIDNSTVSVIGTTLSDISEKVLMAGKDICYLDNDIHQKHEEMISGLAQDLSSKSSNKHSCFKLSSRLSGTKKYFIIGYKIELLVFL